MFISSDEMMNRYRKRSYRIIIMVLSISLRNAFTKIKWSSNKTPPFPNIFLSLSIFKEMHNINGASLREISNVL